MENNVIISIKGMQSYIGMDSDAIELVTEGRFDQEDAGCYTLSFQIEPKRVPLLRVGEFNSQMVFQEGRQHLALYDTPYGALSVAVRTKKMQTCLDPTGGKIEVDYAIEIDHAAAGESLFRIQVRKKPALPQS